jgi:hypothetical protein
MDWNRGKNGSGFEMVKRKKAEVTESGCQIHNPEPYSLQSCSLYMGDKH